MISPFLLSCFTAYKTTCEVWSTATRLFATSTSAKISRIKHELHSIKKETLPFQKIVDVLIEFESRQTQAVRDVPMHAHMVEAPQITMVDETNLCDVHGGRSTSGSCQNIRSSSSCEQATTGPNSGKNSLGPTVNYVGLEGSFGSGQDFGRTAFM
ncbi:hypothetical protein PVK06_047621 [Gossypium arboreum]|uniref:Uncharacterized protein n=1 Tax=Gossypium arboreum TaxID=29729 RepID=A0ABR0MDW0_GOSAR|nr:hypothetical protein PVK06_047621 [Gossypium arboreum]